MRGRLAEAAALAAVGVALTLGAPAVARAESPVIEDVLGILKERGILDDDQYSELRTKNSSYEEKHEKLLGRIEFSGDLRARHESFWFDEDEITGDENSNRHRMRYRLRLDGKAKVNDWITAGFQIASGDDNDSSNVTLGSGDDFDPDTITIRKAYIKAKLPFENTSGSLSFGKLGNPFRWKNGNDYIWDGDFTPEGVAISLQHAFSEDHRGFLHTGYFIIDEEGSSKDPHMFGLQLGGEADLSDRLTVGGRATMYNIRSIDDSMLSRLAREGNLTADLGGFAFEDAGFEGDSNKVNLGELSFYARWKAIEGWPVLAYGSYVQNFSAEDCSLADCGFEADEEDQAFGLGLEVGDKKHVAKLGLAYWEMEANSLPSQFMIDSDLFDGRTNREGFVVYGSRQILENTDFNLTLFVGDEIEDDVVFSDSLGGAERVRLQTDLVVKF